MQANSYQVFPFCIVYPKLLFVVSQVPIRTILFGTESQSFQNLSNILGDHDDRAYRYELRVIFGMRAILYYSAVLYFV